MKSTLIFSGFFRTFEYCYQSLMQDIIIPLDADVYVHSYTTVYTPANMEVSELHGNYSRNDSTVNIDDVNDKLGGRIKSYKLEEYDNTEYLDLVKQLGMPEKNIVNQYHWRNFSHINSICKAVNLFHDTKIHDYDLVIKTRPDVKSVRKIDVSKINLDQISYSYPDGFPTTDLSGPADFPYYFADQLFVSSQKIMCQFKELYPTAIEFAKNGITICNEAVLGRFCQKHNIKFGPADFHFHRLQRDEK